MTACRDNWGRYEICLGAYQVASLVQLAGLLAGIESGIPFAPA